MGIKQRWFGLEIYFEYGKIQCLQTKVKLVCYTAFPFQFHTQTINTGLWALISVHGEQSGSILPLIKMRFNYQMKVY